MSEYLVFRTFRRRQSDVISLIFEKLMHFFLKLPENGLESRHLQAECYGTPFAKQLLLSLLLLLRVPNIIDDQRTQGFCELCCGCQDIHLHILLTFLFFCARTDHHAETQEEISAFTKFACMQETQGTPRKFMEESTGSLF